MIKKKFDELRLTGALPSPSAVGLRILEITKDDDYDQDELTRTIMADPALSGRIIKVANSALNDGGAAVESVPQAAMRLGSKAVRSIALGFTLISDNRSGAADSFDYDKYWSQALATAVSANFLAFELGTFEAAEAFTCGLLADIGSLALASVHPERYSSILIAAPDAAPAQVAELEERTGMGVLASLPLVGRKWRRGKVLSYVLEKPNCALAEAIRNMRTALLLSNIDQPPQTVMVTSSVPSEGKSTSCILLAHMSAQVGKSAIIVECDIRRPTLHKTFGIEEEHDIISVLEGAVSLEEAIWHDEASGLSVLPAIHSTPQAADILSSKLFGAMIEDLRKRYDLILLDTPPVLLVSDASVVGQYADATIYTVRWDHTPRDAVMQGLKRLRDLGVRVSGTVVTLIDQRRAARYSYSRHGYGYYAGDNAYYAD